ncbi:MAG TPA: flagellar biosynthetic protein FliQ [Alphaproteobacteria bacterium]|nr:flagellar biosynthetic protein FliQ [Alphaproteobacteria bacterium]
MSPAEAIDILQAALWLTVELGTPVMLTALGIGLAVGLFQALTSVQELTLTFVPKLLAVGLVIWLSLSAMFRILSNFLNGQLFDALLAI